MYGRKYMGMERATYLIAADGKVPYESVVKVMDELRGNGINKLGLLVDQSSNSGKAVAAAPKKR